jgi:hypothetical protein
VDGEEPGRFLPPEPPGPEPELGGKPPPPPAPPPPAYAQPQPGYQPAWQQQQQQQQQQPPQTWTYPQQRVPDNNQAVTGFILSLVGGGLLFVSAGLSSILSVGLSLAGMILGRQGMKRVDQGETPKHRSLGKAGFWIGLASLILSVIATAIWVAVLIAELADDEVQRDLEREFDESEGLSVVLAATVRLALHVMA